jgi:hypothetical protein
MFQLKERNFIVSNMRTKIHVFKERNSTKRYVKFTYHSTYDYKMNSHVLRK